MRKYLFALLMLAAVPIIASARQISPVTPTSSPSASPSPTVTASPLPTASPTPAPVATPLLSPSVLPTPLVLGPDAPPRILSITVSEPVFHSGDTIASTVITSTNVAAVELRVAGKAVRFPRVDFGVWELSYRLPHIPRRMLHDYAAEIVAMNSSGVTTTFPVTLSLR
ncbi:MAG TPA: hypothetical protein VGR69_02180 [Candidatus Rubrimentiphilum sp.]|nr:hypothetical protein [Candidatus Rubrimentiphilum sp.]